MAVITRDFPICIESILLKCQKVNQILFSDIPLFTSTNVVEIAELL